MRDLLFEAGDELVSGLGPPSWGHSESTRNSFKPQASAGPPAHSHKVMIDVHGLLLHGETREMVCRFSFKGGKD